MNENDLFKKSKVDIQKLLQYGFKKLGKQYQYSVKILQDTFLLTVLFDENQKIQCTVYDLTFQEEYYNFRISSINGPFVQMVREEIEKILKDILEKCFIVSSFTFPQTNRIVKNIQKKYGHEPEFLWKDKPHYGVFRNEETKKWYGILMNINQSKIEKGKNGEIEILNLKIDSQKIIKLSKIDGFYPAYHMNKKYWITILLNDSVSDVQIMNLIEESYCFSKK